MVFVYCKHKVPSYTTSLFLCVRILQTSLIYSILPDQLLTLPLESIVVFIALKACFVVLTILSFQRFFYARLEYADHDSKSEPLSEYLSLNFLTFCLSLLNSICDCEPYLAIFPLLSMVKLHNLCLTGRNDSHFATSNRLLQSVLLR